MSWWEYKTDLEQETKEPKQRKKEEPEDRGHKDRDCIGCLKFWDCKGKPRGARCIH